jgi:hypothetical protein
MRVERPAIQSQPSVELEPISKNETQTVLTQTESQTATQATKNTYPDK